MPTIVSLVAAGVGIALVPGSVRNLHMAGLVYRDLQEEPMPEGEVAIAWRRGESSPVLDAFIHVAKEIASIRRTAPS